MCILHLNGKWLSDVACPLLAEIACKEVYSAALNHLVTIALVARRFLWKMLTSVQTFANSLLRITPKTEADIVPLQSKSHTFCNMLVRWSFDFENKHSPFPVSLLISRYKASVCRNGLQQSSSDLGNHKERFDAAPTFWLMSSSNSQQPLTNWLQNTHFSSVTR